MGQRVESPWFTAAGHEWRLRVYPDGEDEEAAGHLSGDRRGRQRGTCRVSAGRRRGTCRVSAGACWEMPQRASRSGSGGSQHSSSATPPLTTPVAPQCT